MAVRIEFGDVVFRCLGKVASGHVLHARLVDDVGFEGLLVAFLSIVAYEHDLHVLLVRVVVCLLAHLLVRFALSGVRVCIAAQLDLFDAVVAAHFR